MAIQYVTILALEFVSSSQHSMSQFWQYNLLAKINFWRASKIPPPFGWKIPTPPFGRVKGGGSPLSEQNICSRLVGALNLYKSVN